MIYGLDTSFLVAAELHEHPLHTFARGVIEGIRQKDQLIAIAPQVLIEFIHVVTDAKRVQNPFSMAFAIDAADGWWQGDEVLQVFPSDAAARQCLTWLRQHKLGRKRLLDTMLAATYRHEGVLSLLTTNVRDFTVFGCFQFVTPGSEAPDGNNGSAPS